MNTMLMSFKEIIYKNIKEKFDKEERNS